MLEKYGIASYMENILTNGNLLIVNQDKSLRLQTFKETEYDCIKQGSVHE